MKSLAQYIKEHLGTYIIETKKHYIADEDDMTDILDFNNQTMVMVGSHCLGKDIQDLIKELEKYGYDNINFDLDTILSDNGINKHEFDNEKWVAVFYPADETKEITFMRLDDVEFVEESMNEAKKDEEVIFKFRTEKKQDIESIPNIKGLYIRPNEEKGIAEFVCSSPEGIAAAIMAMRFLVAGTEEVESLEEIEDYLVDNTYDLDELLNNAVAVIGNDRAKEIQDIVKRL